MSSPDIKWSRRDLILPAHEYAPWKVHWMGEALTYQYVIVDSRGQLVAHVKDRLTAHAIVAEANAREKEDGIQK